MPITGLTDRGAQFPRIGILRKGGPKVSERQPGPDLKDHFRFESEHADALRTFRAAYGERPNHIRVRLLYPTTAQNFDAWKEHHSAGALKRRCDGQTCVLQLCQDGTYDRAPTACVCATELAGADKKHLCRPVGRLKIVIPELDRFGYVLVPTTSIHDIIELQSNLEAAEALRGDLRGIPFVLSRRPRKVSMASDEGQRRRVEKWLLSLEIDPTWVHLQLAAMDRAALPLLAPGVPERQIDRETGEIFADEEVDEEPVRVAGPTSGEALGYVVEARDLTNGDGVPVLRFSVGEDTFYARDRVARAWMTMESGDYVRVAWRHGINPRTGAMFFEATAIAEAHAPDEAEVRHV